MTAFRPFDPFQTFTDQHGALNAGGQLVFFDSGTTTPRDVFADQALTTNLGNSVTIGTDGRPVSDIWASGNYRVRLLDVNNVQIGPDRDNVQVPGGTAATLPTPFVPDAFLTNDGALPLWSTIQQVPDPTGQSGKVLSSDGTTTTWITPASPPAAANITAGDNSLRAADTTNTTKSSFIQAGSASIPPTGAHTATGAVTFPVPFKAGTVPVVIPVTSGGPITPGGYYGVPSFTSVSNTGFTFMVNVNEGGAESPNNITSTVNFSYIAIGVVDSPA